MWVPRQEPYSISTASVAKYRERSAGELEESPRDGEALLDEPVSDPPRTTVRLWNFTFLGCTVPSRMTADEAPQLG